MFSQYIPFWYERMQSKNRPAKESLWHAGGCYYVGGATRTLREILMTAPNPRAVCEDCIKQLTAMLEHLHDKGIPYVHGDLTVDNVVRSLHGQYFIVDIGVTKRASVKDPFAHYRDLNGDLQKLKVSMDECIRMETVLKAVLYNGRLHFQPMESI